MPRVWLQVNANTRGTEHMQRGWKEVKKDLYYGDTIEKHVIEWQEFQMLITGHYGHDAILKQIANNTRILSKISTGSLINSKKE